jgi:hypothetical protein
MPQVNMHYKYEPDGVTIQLSMSEACFLLEDLETLVEDDCICDETGIFYEELRKVVSAAQKD